MQNKFKIHRQIAILIVSVLTIGLSYPAMAKKETTEIEDFCFRNRHDSICKDQESYISLEKWKNNKTVCSLATEWENEERKCRVVADDNKIIIYVEKEVVSESLPNTLKTQVMTVSLDEIFTFDTQWWLADVEVTRVTTTTPAANSIESSNNSLPDYSSRTASNAAGAFTELQIGFITQANNSANSDVKFLTVSSQNLHQIIEQMESWRFYLPDLKAFESKIKAIANSNPTTNVASNLTKLEETNQCPGCDLRNADLSKLNLENANLQGANLAGANLAETKLKSAYLLGANLTEANLVDVSLETANLTFASLAKADLSEANLKGANLQNTDLNSANLNGAELKAKDLQSTSLKNANLNNANLTDADLRCVNFQSASLKKANLTNINLSPCEEKQSLLFASQLSNVRLNGAGIPYTVGNDLANAVNLIGGIISALSNPGAGLVTSFSSPTVKYRQAGNLSGANLNGANLTDADLSGVYLTDTNLSNAILVDTKLKGNILSNANFIATNIEEVKFENPILICQATFSDESIYEEYCQSEEE